MFVSDQAGNLDAGTLYAAKWLQRSSSNGGSADIEWIRLGHASSTEIEALANTLEFTDIFDFQSSGSSGFKLVDSAWGANEWLRLKPGMEKAAAFLESSRYAGYLGATSEFNKMEGLAANEEDNELYMAITGVRYTMEEGSSSPDIQLDRIKAGAVYAFDLDAGVRDTQGNLINSEYVATFVDALITGTDISTDSAGNRAAVDNIASPDNIFYVIYW